MGQEVVGERKGQILRRRGESGIHLEIAFWARNYRVKTGMFPFLDREIEAQRLQRVAEFVGIGRFRGKTEKRAASWSVNGRVRRILAPFNEKRQKARGRIRERHNLPFQKLPVRAFARTWCRPLEHDSGGVELFCERRKTAGVSGPAN